MVRLARIADAWDRVAGTAGRAAKTSHLADVLTALAPEEVAVATAMLTGEPRQGRIGIGWASLRDLEVPAATTATLTVPQVDALLTRLADTHGPGSQAQRRALLEELFAAATAAEQAYLRGLLLGNLRQGALEAVVMAAVAEAAGVQVDHVRRAAMLTGDVTAAAVVAMTRGVGGLAAVTLKIGRPVLAMLAQSAPDVASALARTGRAAVETKLDGMRIQAHRTGNDVTIVTRSLREITAELPGVAEVVRGLPVDRVILDGEAMAFTAGRRPLPFQDSMRSLGGAALQPRFFDILHREGTDLLDEPLTRRLAALDEVVPADLRVARVVTTDPDEAGRHLATALAQGHEGVVIKALDAPYEAGRRGGAWVKVKVAHTLDLVVLAAEWGSGRRRGWLSNLHLGARDADTGEFVMLGKTFKGLTDQLLAWQTEHLLARALTLDSHDHAVVHVRPELVVEVAFDGVQRSTRYPAGLTLRFARVRRYRPDKRPAQADTVATVAAIHRGERAPRTPG